MGRQPNKQRAFILAVLTTCLLVARAFEARRACIGSLAWRSTNVRPNLRLYVKKIDEELGDNASGDKKKGGGKTDKKGKRSRGNEDWRARKAADAGESSAVEGSVKTEAVAETVTEQQVGEAGEAPDFIQQLIQDAALLAELGEDSVSAAAVVAALGSAEDSPDSDADEVSFINTMSMESGVGPMDVDAEGLFDSAVAGGGKGKQKSAAERPRIPRPLEYRVPRNAPLSGGVVPPEIVFFGDPRRPPPVSASANDAYKFTLLYWARHGNVIPRGSAERLERVFPKGRNEPAPAVSSLRLPEDNAGLSYDVILNKFLTVMDDLEQSKAFIAANVDLVPARLFLMAITAKKLAAQSRNDLTEMQRLKNVRDRYQLASDQLYFPLEIEVKKAETRVMTYMARDELRNFAGAWDEVESTLHMAALLAARLDWDAKCQKLADRIQNVVKGVMPAFQESTQRQLVKAEMARPLLTSEVYRNATLGIQQNMPALWAKIAPEVRAIQETYSLAGLDEYDEVERYLVNDFLPREGISREDMLVRLKLFDANIASLQGNSYSPLRQRAVELIALLSTEAEIDSYHGWYRRAFAASQGGYGFDTYAPDKLDIFTEETQRTRPMDNAFAEFYMQVLKAPTLYTQAFAGKRPKASAVDNWLNRDPLWAKSADDAQKRILEAYNRADQELSPTDGVVEESEENIAIENFRQLYRKQMELRLAEEARLPRLVLNNRMEEHDRILGGKDKLVIEFQEPAEQ